MKKNTFAVLSICVLALLVVPLAGCLDMGGSGRLMWTDLPEGGDDSGDDGGIVDGGDDGGDDGGIVDNGDDQDEETPGDDQQTTVPDVAFDFEAGTYDTMREKSVTATFDQAVEDCGSGEVNGRIQVLDNAGAPVACDYVWNEACTEVHLERLDLNYATSYQAILRNGLVFQEGMLANDILTPFTMPANYHSMSEGRYAEYPIAITPLGYVGEIYSGDVILPDILPRVPLEFDWTEPAPLFSFAPPDMRVWYPSENFGKGRFGFMFEDSGTGSEALMLWRDLDLAPIAMTFRPAGAMFGSYVLGVAYTKDDDPEAIGLNDNALQDLVVAVYNMDMGQYEIYVFYDWTGIASDITYADADWSLMHEAVGWGIDVGDINGDGRADLCLLAIDAGTERYDVECYFGGVAGIARAPDATFLLTDDNEIYILRMGDVNCDGFSDIVIGGSAWPMILDAPIGELRVLAGGSGIAGMHDVGADLSPALTIHASASPLGENYVVSDVDGDRCSDIFVLEGGSMRLFAYQGSASWTPAAPQVIDAETGADVIFTDADITGLNEDFGSMLAHLDLNGDGYNDLMFTEYVMDLEHRLWKETQVFVPGGTEFFGLVQEVKSRAGAGVHFVVRSSGID